MDGRRTGEPSIDLVVVVDWSASSVPRRGRDSIWIATVDVASDELTLVNPPTRREAAGSLCGVLRRARDRRVLVGIDVPLGYPAGFAAALPSRGADDRGWRAVWGHLTAEIHDDDRNRNDRFEVAARLNAMTGAGPGPFWGCPPSVASADLRPRKEHRFPVHGPDGPIEEWRLTERRCMAVGPRPLPVWQTAYAGSVGSQALVAIPVLARLIADPRLADRTEVWPFTTGLRAPDRRRGDVIVIAEVWPSWFVSGHDTSVHEVRDAAQVSTTGRALAGLARSGGLEALLAPAVDARDVPVVVREEGWILGVP